MRRPTEEAPILSNGLATVEIGESREVVQTKLGEALSIRAGKIASDGVEILEYGHTCIILDQGIVTSLLALNGYRGMTEDGLHVGMTWHQLLRTVPGIVFDHDYYCWVAPGRPWLQIEVARPLRAGESSDDGVAQEWYEVLDPDHAWVHLIAVWKRPASAVIRQVFPTIQ